MASILPKLNCYTKYPYFRSFFHIIGNGTKCGVFSTFSTLIVGSSLTQQSYSLPAILIPNLRILAVSVWPTQLITFLVYFSIFSTLISKNAVLAQSYIPILAQKPNFKALALAVSSRDLWIRESVTHHHTLVQVVLEKSPILVHGNIYINIGPLIVVSRY